MYNKYVKRPLDVILSLCAILILLPLLLLTSILVRLKLGTPVIFKQKRPGLNGKIFTLYKFRTMTEKRDVNGELLPDSERLTKFGRMLRSTSIDELPELFNIFKGDMSMIGPRPLAVQYLEYYNENERRRHNVRPGLSGLAQINGRNALGWEEKFKYDIIYVDNISLKMDIKIICISIKKVFQRSDIGERGVDSPIDFDEYRRNQQKKERII